MVDQEHSLEHFSGRTGRGLVRLERQDGPRARAVLFPVAVAVDMLVLLS